MRRTFRFGMAAGGLAGVLVAVGSAGCARRPSDAELGRVVEELPVVPGADVPYPLPDLTPEGGDGVSEPVGPSPAGPPPPGSPAGEP